MTESQVGLLVGGALVLLIMPTSLDQFGQTRRQIKDGNVRDAMLRRPPDTSFKPRQFLIGAALASAWVAVWLVALVA
jgi:hypothetical protein